MEIARSVYFEDSVRDASALLTFLRSEPGAEIVEKALR